MIGGKELKSELTKDHKYQILQAFYASPKYTLEEKRALMQKALEHDKSDRAQQVQEVCEKSLPDKDLKQKLWEEITAIESKDSMMVYQ